MQGEGGIMKKLKMMAFDSFNDDEDHFIAAAAVNIPFQMLFSADEPKRKGSVIGHRVIDRDRASGHDRIFKDYFADNPVYPEKNFRRRYRMSKRLFNKIHADIVGKVPYFVQKKDAAGKMGVSSLQKITAALRMLANEVPSDIVG
jgi:hypothetical protein